MSLDFKFGKKGYIPKRFLEIPTPKINPYIPLRIDYRVHLHSRNGTYRVISVSKDFASITCQTWINQHSRGERRSDKQLVHRSDIKCLYGQGWKYKNM